MWECVQGRMAALLLHQGPAYTGCVPTKTMKKSAWVITEKYCPHLSDDFRTNKRACKEITIISIKKLCCYSPPLMRQVQRAR